MAFIVEKAKWCVRNPSACAGVAAQGARERVQQVKERISRPQARQVPRAESDPRYRSEVRRAREYDHRNGTIRDGQRVGGTRQTQRESRKRLRAQDYVVKEFCVEHPEDCQAKRQVVETQGWCAAFPERCKSDPKFKNLHDRHEELGGMGLRHRNDVREEYVRERRREAEAKVKEKENSRTEFWLSTPGRFVDAIGTAYESGRVKSRKAVKDAGTFLGVAPPYRYAQKARKAKKPKTKASKALRNVDKITNKIIG